MRLRIEYKTGQEEILFPERVNFSNFPRDHLIAVLKSGKEEYYYLSDINRFDVYDKEQVPFWVND